MSPLQAALDAERNAAAQREADRVSDAYEADMSAARTTAHSVLDNGKRRLSEDMAEERVQLNSLRAAERKRRNTVNGVIRAMQREEEEIGEQFGCVLCCASGSDSYSIGFASYFHSICF